MNQAQRQIVEGMSSLIEGLFDEAKAIYDFCKEGDDLGTVSHLLSEAKRFIDKANGPYYNVFFPKDRLNDLEVRYKILNHKLKQ